MLFASFPLLLLIFFSLCLILITLSNMCLDVFLLGFILYGTLWAFWTWVSISFPMLGKFLTIKSSNIFSYPLFFSSSGISIIQFFMYLMLFQRSLRLYSFLFILFFFNLLCFSYFHHSAHFLVILSSVPSGVFLISIIVLFFDNCLLFISSFFFNISRIFSIHASSLFICASICFQNFG